MKNRQEFIEAWKHQLFGLLMLSFHESNPDTVRFDNKKIGYDMLQQMKRANAMLGEMYDSMNDMPLEAKK